MKHPPNRRRNPRWPVELLAKCYVDHQGLTFVSDMRLADVNGGGLRLLTPAPDAFSAESDLPGFTRGDRVVLRDVFYDDDGAHALSGSIRWARRDPLEGSWALGVHLREKDRDEVKAFREFLAVIRTA